MNSSRRALLKASLGLAAALAGAKAWAQDQEPKKAGKKGKGKKGKGKKAQGGTAEKIPIGLQLYVLRQEFAKDVPGVLKKVAEMGYQGVEFWGYEGTEYVYKDAAGKQWTAEELRALLDEDKLKCCGIHLSAKALAPAAIERTIAVNKTLGNRYLNISWAADQMKSAELIKKFADSLNAAADKASAEKMTVGYHAHGPDFIKVGDQFAWDILFGQLKPEVNMQVDIGNSLSGGGDPLGALKKYPGRTQTIHLKTYQEKTFESDYYKEVFQVLDTQHPVKWYIVEEGEAAGGFDTPRKALETLKKLGK